MTIEQAVKQLADELDQDFNPGVISISHNGVDIYINEHHRIKSVYHPVSKYEGYHVIKQYVGKIKPA